MAEFEYVQVNGRDIRVRPTETGNEIDEYGNFHRQPNRFTLGFGEGKNPVERDRYILFWGKGCNWSNRAAIARELLGLQDAIKVEIVDWADHERPLGWEFVNSPNHINPETGAQFLSELYYNADPEYAGRTTVPALVDYTTKKVVNNNYHRLTNHFEVDFRPFHKKDAPDLYPEELREEIDALNDWLFENVNNAIYRAQFAESLQAFSDAYETFFAGLEAMDRRLADRRFLFGDYVTDSDIRLYVTLARFDVSYSRHIAPSLHRLVDYENLWPYARDLYQIPAFRHNTYFKDFAASEDLSSVPYSYWENFYYDIVVQETDWDTVWKTATGRERLSRDPAHKFRLEKNGESVG
ncbi:MAG: glutathione S-transferase C-terminal domain-containing protein [Lachnospiraceae bacterium]|nr:glutathione S-transferase C-terminal domain-containing protein [Lachnospiraceae bacterium]